MNNIVEREIEEYVTREEIPGALLLTGKWGSGKTYLVREIAKKLNENKKAAVGFVSLFGINSVADLRNRVKGEYLKFSLGFFYKPARIAKKYSKVLSDSVSLASTAAEGNIAVSAAAKGLSALTSYDMLSFFEVKNTIGKDRSIPFVIVFDDFERCEGISIKDRLGVINEYIESKSIRTIILADEDKIAGNDYTEFKEKLISKTIRLTVNQDTVDAIIDNYKTGNKKYKDYVVAKKGLIKNAFNHSQYFNLRTLKTCLYDFERIYNMWNELKIPFEEIDPLFYKFCAIVYETKAGNYKGIMEHLAYIISTDAFEGEEDKAQMKRNEEIKAKYIPEAFSGIPSYISRWVVDGDWNETELKGELQRTYFAKELSFEERFLFYSFWDLQQEDIIQGMPIVIDHAYKGEATRKELVALLEKTYAVKMHHIPVPCEIDYHRIEDGLKKRCEKIKLGIIDEPLQHICAEDTYIEKEAIPVNELMRKMDDKIAAWRNRRDFIAFLRNSTTMSRYTFTNRCIDEFDDELFSIFMDEYKNSQNHRRRELCIVLKEIHFDIEEFSDIENIENTIRNLSGLNDQVKEEANSNQDYIAVAISNSFIKILEDKLTTLKKKREKMKAETV